MRPSHPEMNLWPYLGAEAPHPQGRRQSRRQRVGSMVPPSGGWAGEREKRGLGTLVRLRPGTSEGPFADAEKQPVGTFRGEHSEMTLM